MRRLLAACLLLLSLPLYGLPTGSVTCGHAPLLQLAMGESDAVAPVSDSLQPLLQAATWAIVGESPRLLRDDLQSAPAPVYSWLPPLQVPRAATPALPDPGVSRGLAVRLRIGSVQQLL